MADAITLDEAYFTVTLQDSRGRTWATARLTPNRDYYVTDLGDLRFTCAILPRNEPALPYAVVKDDYNK